MDFYSFDLGGKICKDIAATAIASILPPYWNENLVKHNEALILEHVRLGNATRS